jgi:hypothetical protein
MKPKGTPQTLIEAILNGLEESGSDAHNGITAAFVEKHLHEYIANCFGLINEPESIRVFSRIFRGSTFGRQFGDE